MPAVQRVIRRARRPGPLVAVSVAYLVLVSGIMIWRGISVSPDYLLLILVPVALVSGRFFAFLRDWVPFVALFLGYEALSGSHPSSVSGLRSASMVHIERALFLGRDPSEVLQRHFGALHWLAIACTVIYFCHFLFPIAVGMVLWLVDRTKFLRFTVAVLAMSFAAFVFFLLLPTAPPWYAHNLGLLPGVHDLLTVRCPARSAPTSSGWTPTPPRRSPRCTRPIRRWVPSRSGRSAGARPCSWSRGAWRCGSASSSSASTTSSMWPAASSSPSRPGP